MLCALNVYVDIRSTHHSGSLCTELTSSAFIGEFYSFLFLCSVLYPGFVSYV